MRFQSVSFGLVGSEARSVAGMSGGEVGSSKFSLSVFDDGRIGTLSFGDGLLGVVLLFVVIIFS